MKQHNQQVSNIDYEREISSLLLMWGDGKNPIPEDRKGDLEAFGAMLLARVDIKFEQKIAEAREECTPIIKKGRTKYSLEYGGKYWEQLTAEEVINLLSDSRDE